MVLSVHLVPADAVLVHVAVSVLVAITPFVISSAVLKLGRWRCRHALAVALLVQGVAQLVPNPRHAAALAA